MELVVLKAEFLLANVIQLRGGGIVVKINPNFPNFNTRKLKAKNHYQESGW